MSALPGESVFECFDINKAPFMYVVLLWTFLNNFPEDICEPKCLKQMERILNGL